MHVAPSLFTGLLAILGGLHGVTITHLLGLRKDHNKMTSTVDTILGVIEEIKTGVTAVSTAVPAIPEGYVTVAQSDLDKIEAALHEVKPLLDAVAPIVKKDGVIGAVEHEVSSFFGKA